MEIILGLLGPDGTFTAEAGANYIKRTGIQPDIKWYKTIEDCFDSVDSGEVQRAVVPILNSTGAGWINPTLKRLRQNGVRVYDEQILPIRLYLAALPGVRLEDIAYVHSKKEALEQCRKLLIRLGSKLREENSTAAAAELLQKTPSCYDRAAVVPLRAVEIYGLNVLKSDVQDDSRNKTRFIVISKQDHEPTGDDKTTAIFEFKDVERPCLLYAVIKELAERGISLSYIQSIPKDGKLDEFTFYIDMIGHRKDKNLAEALTAIERNQDLSYWRVLGSYPMFKE